MADKEQQAEGNKKPSKMLMIIVIVVIGLALVIGGGAAVYYYMSKNLIDIESAGHSQGQQDEESKSADLYYHNVSKPLIVDFPRGTSARLIQVSLAFQVGGQDVLEDLKKHDPMIRSKILMLISSESPDSLNTPEGKDELRANILESVGSVLKEMTGKNDVKEVFFTAFVMQ